MHYQTQKFGEHQAIWQFLYKAMSINEEKKFKKKPTTQERQAHKTKK